MPFGRPYFRGSGETNLVGYEVVVVGDGDLAGAAWTFVRDGRGKTYLLVTGAALARNPERCLTRASEASRLVGAGT